MSGTYARPETMLRDDRASTDLLGMEVTEMSEGHAVVTMTVRGDMLNGHAIIHGGLVFTAEEAPQTALAPGGPGGVGPGSGGRIPAGPGSRNHPDFRNPGSGR